MEEEKSSTAKETVKIIRQIGKSVLIEYRQDSKLRRCTIPANKVVDQRKEGNILFGDVNSKTIAMGVPYGVDWERMSDIPQLTADMIADALHESGIWTVDDIQKNPIVIQQVVLSLTGRLTSKIVRHAHKKEVLHE